MTLGGVDVIVKHSNMFVSQTVLMVFSYISKGGLFCSPKVL